MAELPRLVAHAKKRAPGLRAHPRRTSTLRRSRPARRSPRFPSRARAISPRLQKETPPLRRAERHAGREARQDLHLARADLRPGRPRPELVAHGARPVRRRLPRRRPRSQHLRLPLHARGLDARVGRRRARLHRDPGRRRADRDAGGGDSRPARQRVRRHAVVPQADRREGRRAEGRHLEPREGAGRRGVSAARLENEPCTSAASASPSATPAPTSASSPTSRCSPMARRIRA